MACCAKDAPAASAAKTAAEVVYGHLPGRRQPYRDKALAGVQLLRASLDVMTLLRDDQATTLIFTTIARDSCARRLIDSALALYPNLRILVADQNPRTQEMTDFYRARNVDVDWVPYDFGVSAGRAALARRVHTPFLLYGDDDFIFTRNTRITPVIDFLMARPDVSVITGGMVDETLNKNGIICRTRRRYETLMYHDRWNRGLISLPIDYGNPRVDVHNGNTFYSCDLGLNWAVARTALFNDPRFLWDPQFKSNGEHENFFLQIKTFGGGRVMFYPEMECDHAPYTDPQYEQLRSRTSGWAAFGKKWDVDWVLHVGKSFHRYEDYDRSMIRFEAGAPGSAPQLPSRPHDYLRVWANGFAAASVSSRSPVVEANNRARAIREGSDERIRALRARLEAADADNKRMAERLQAQRAQVKTFASAVPEPIAEARGEEESTSALRKQNRELKEKISRVQAINQTQRENMERLRRKLRGAVVDDGGCPPSVVGDP